MILDHLVDKLADIRCALVRLLHWADNRLHDLQNKVVAVFSLSYIVDLALRFLNAHGDCCDDKPILDQKRYYLVEVDLFQVLTQKRVPSNNEISLLLGRHSQRHF